VSLLRVYGLTHLEHWKWDIWEAESRAKLDQLNNMAESAEETQLLTTTTSTEIAGSNVESLSFSTEDLAATNDNPASSPNPVVAGGQSVESEFTQEPTIHPNTKAGASTSPGESTNPSTSASSSLSDATVTALSPQVSVTSTPNCTVQTEYVNHSNLSTTATYATNDTTKMDDIPRAPPEVLLETTQVTPAQPKTTTHEISSVETSEPHQQVETPTTQTVTTSTFNAVHNNHNASSRSSSTSTSSTTSIHSPTLSIPLPLPPPAPTGGESIYRTIMNRLTALEANHTLYARYVEEQTTGVRDVLRRLGEDVGRVEAIVSVPFTTCQSLSVSCSDV
jgi:hypothetical protein